MQRHPTFAVPLLAAHLGATEPAAALHAYAECAGLHRGLHRALHGPPERDPAAELIGDALREQHRVDFGLLDLLDVELDLRVAADLAQTFAKPFGLGAPATDDDAGSGGVHVDAQTVTRALDLDAAHRGALELLPQVVADLVVLDEELGVFLLVGDPTRLPVGGDAETESVGVDLLTHRYSSPASSSAVVVGLIHYGLHNSRCFGCFGVGRLDRGGECGRASAS